MNRYFLGSLLLSLLISSVFNVGQAQVTLKYWQYAPTPPLVWNSRDIYGTTVTE